MKTLTIELPDDAASEAEARARLAKMTLAEWVAARIMNGPGKTSGGRDAMGYPSGWFERTTGQLGGIHDLQEPEDPPLPPAGSIEL